MISQLSQGSNVESGQRTVFHAAQSALLAIPGHATYYQDRIESLRRQVVENDRKPEQEKRRMESDNIWVGLADYDEARAEAFNILGLLPGPEAVAVLGHFLNDPEGRDGNTLLGSSIWEGEDSGPSRPNCALAFMALSNMGIEHPPTAPSDPHTGMDYDLERIDAWKDWWNEIKAGKRTYRFTGSSIEYGPDGPANKDRASGGAGRTAGSATEATSDAESPSKTLPVALALAALAVVASLVWWFSGKRKGGMMPP